MSRPVGASGDPEIALEQGHLDRSHRALEAMRSRAEQLLADLQAAGQPDLDYVAALTRRVSQLQDSRRPLLFGRIDDEGGETWRIGRRHVEEVDHAAGDVLVVDWRAPVSTPFYRASPADPLGLKRRRQIMVDDRRVVAVADDLFGPLSSASAEDVERTRLRGGDALLAELERARTGEMLDIVATIQAEQDEVIRAPMEGLLAVQGGPGTGKTAVALHRAAYLLYNHPELTRAGVLVVGPSRAFLRYIAQVLPSLGEESVLQVTVLDLVSRMKIRGVDDPVAARVKGDIRMAAVLERSLRLARGKLDRPVSLTARHRVVTLEPEDVNALADAIAARRMPYKAGRAAVQARLVSLARHRMRAAGRYEGDEPWFAKELTSTAEFAKLRDLLWPQISAPQLVVDLLGRPGLLDEAAAGILGTEEIAALRRARPQAIRSTPWTWDDVALLDEAHFLLSGQARTYGHVIVDEVQDLSPMQLRMIARRVPRGSLTVLGDIAQASGTWSYGGWDEIVPHLDPAGQQPVRREELTLGYRAPGQVLDLASRLLPLTAPGVTPTRSVRRGRSEPAVVRVGAEAELAGAALAEARCLASEHQMLVGLIVAPGPVEDSVTKLAGRAPDVGRLDSDGITRPITIVPAPGAKGLEFDAAVVVEPSAIAGDSVRGLRLLYVALTRPIQHLSIVHSAPLPEPLRSTGGA
jgi:DNA helicase IV